MKLSIVMPVLNEAAEIEAALAALAPFARAASKSSWSMAAAATARPRWRARSPTG